MNRLPFGIGDFVTQLKEATFKGDSPGHPFRGNQYEGGGASGSDYVEKKEPKARTESAAILKNQQSSGGYSALSQHVLSDVVSHQETTSNDMESRLSKNPKIGKSGAKHVARILNDYTESGVIGIGWKPDGNPRYFTNITKDDIPIAGASYL